MKQQSSHNPQFEVCLWKLTIIGPCWSQDTLLFSKKWSGRAQFKGQGVYLDWVKESTTMLAALLGCTYIFDMPHLSSNIPIRYIFCTS